MTAAVGDQREDFGGEAVGFRPPSGLAAARLRGGDAGANPGILNGLPKPSNTTCPHDLLTGESYLGKATSTSSTAANMLSPLLALDIEKSAEGLFDFAVSMGCFSTTSWRQFGTIHSQNTLRGRPKMNKAKSKSYVHPGEGRGPYSTTQSGGKMGPGLRRDGRGAVYAFALLAKNCAGRR